MSWLLTELTDLITKLCHGPRFLHSRIGSSMQSGPLPVLSRGSMTPFMGGEITPVTHLFSAIYGGPITPFTAIGSEPTLCR